ncbi:hypothetical protein B0H13DRAFT_2347142 [Mycena leptocephala]|nr:hypothetical protein B0H13DRAFT_2347142 [Mycena leptocephala]
MALQMQKKINSPPNISTVHSVSHSYPPRLTTNYACLGLHLAGLVHEHHPRGHAYHRCPPLSRLSPDRPRIQSLMRSVIYFLLYIYSFDIANQINGVAEDRINKPDRPLSSGRVTLQGAYIRWYATTVVHLVLGAAWGVLPWTALWVLITIYTSSTAATSTGGVGARRADHGARVGWVLLLSGVFGIVASVQDMRDVEGDRVAGRRTLPIVLGSNFRWVMTLIICAAPAGIALRC